MRQAIEEGFIMDVLANYTTYKTCYKVAKNTPDNPEVPASKAMKLMTRRKIKRSRGKGENPSLCGLIDIIPRIRRGS